MSPAMWTGNHWDVADQLDAFGTSLFPENSHEPFSEEEFGIRVEILRSAAGSKVPWVSELSGWAAARQAAAVGVERLCQGR